MIYGTHGEIPKIVIHPSTVEECFYDTVEAFNLADRYQCPVIVMTDLQLSLGKQSAETLDYARIKIDRGSMIGFFGGEQVFKSAGAGLEHTVQPFDRYRLTDSGISTRTLPGQRGGVHHVTGAEHDANGRPSDNSDNRTRMMDKRLRKLAGVRIAQPFHFEAARDCLQSCPKLLLVGIGSTRGAMEEARELLGNEGIAVNLLTVRQLHPFPGVDIAPYLDEAAQVIVIEHNADGQLAGLIKLHCGGDRVNIEGVRRYDGNPFIPSEIYRACRTLWLHTPIKGK